jgi:hypothetical protein
MELIDTLEGDGHLTADGKEFSRVTYSIEVWQALSGAKWARGKISVSPEIGPGKLTLQDGRKLEVFVTTSGAHGGTIIVSAPIPDETPRRSLSS